MHPPLTTTPDGLIISSNARTLGEHQALVDARSRGILTRVRRGVYLENAHAESLKGAEEYRLRSLAVAAQRHAPVLAGCSAAVLHGLPLVGSAPDDVFVLSSSESGRHRNGVVELVRPNAEIEMHDGIAMTSVVDTLIDVARTCSLLTALVMFDAALAGDDPLCTRAELEAAFADRLPFPGSRKVRAVLDRCTELAESPLETLSRWQIENCGFPMPELQVPVFVPALGTTVRLDMVWREYGIWGEADGRGKYELNGDDGRSPAERVYAEKRREDAVRHVTKWSCARWGWTEAWKRGPLQKLLTEAGLPRTSARWTFA